MCGISGGNGPVISKDKLKILALYNDSRGGDSCGIWDGHLVTEHSEKARDGKGYFWNALLKMNFNINVPTVLFHARAASPGIEVNAANAHPFIIGNIVGTHNGIIRNSAALCEKYGVEKEKSDSKSLFKIIEKLKTRNKIVTLLKEYVGAAALAWTDTNEPGSLYLYRGESLKLPDTNGLWEERPLFIGKIGDTLYYSSIETSLKAIDCELIDFEGNYLYKFINGVQKWKLFVDRTKCYQDFPSVTKYYQTNIFNGPTKKEPLVIPAVSKTFVDDKLFTEPLPSGFLSPGGKGTGGKIYFNKGQYYRNGHRISKGACSKFYISDDGFQVWNPDEIDENTGRWNKFNEDQTDIINGGTYYFFHGSMFIDALAMARFKYDYFKDGKLYKLDLSIDKFFQSPINFNLSEHMFDFKISCKVEGWWAESKRLNGWCNFPLDDTAYKFKDGECIEIVPKKEPVEVFEKFDDIVDDISDGIDEPTLEDYIREEKPVVDEFLDSLTDTMGALEEFCELWEPSKLTKSEKGCYKIIEDAYYELLEAELNV